MVTLRCDVCVMPYIATNTFAQLHEIGWLTRDGGHPIDVCHVCRRRRQPSELVPRTSRPIEVLSEERAMPTFFIVGAGKSATTSMHAYLDLHPEIGMSIVKEPQFFADPDGHEWREHYESMFDPAYAVRGESSTAYSQWPLIPGVPERLLDAVPDAPLIYMIRDPIDRAVSWWTEMRMHSNDNRPFTEAFADVEDPFSTYVATSRYASQLKMWLEHVPLERFCFVEMDELASDPAGTLARVCHFLGVNPTFDFAGARERFNVGEDKQEYAGVALRLRNSLFLRWVYQLPPAKRERLLAPVRRAFARPMERPVVDDDLRARLSAVLKPEADEFRTITGRAFARWSV
jgi:hypothetical protein